jgi:hypothetical protein
MVEFYQTPFNVYEGKSKSLVNGIHSPSAIGWEWQGGMAFCSSVISGPKYGPVTERWVWGAMRIWAPFH